MSPFVVIYQQSSSEYTEENMSTARTARHYTTISVRMMVALGVFALLMLTFIKLALEVTESQAPRFDQPILLGIHAHASPVLDRLVPLLTELGGPVVVTCTTMALTLLFLRRRQFARVMIIVGGVAGGAALNLILKAYFGRPRPMLWPRLVSEGNFSFPSGHAMTTMALVAAIIAVLWYTRWRRHAIILGSLYVLVIGLTRMYLGVHYPSDVLGGWAIGAVWVIVVVYIVRQVTRSSKVRGPQTKPSRE